MRFSFTVEVEVERVQGKFASRDELSDQMVEWLENANEGSLTGENEGEYEVTDWTVEPLEAK